MTAQITGVGTASCHWPLEKAVNPISLLYTDADMVANLREAERRGGAEITYRGPQGEITVATRELKSSGRLWSADA